MCVILGGGKGTRLAPLTTFRSKPAVPLGGKYRLIDIPVSNCLNSGLGKIYVLTQFNSVSLHRHIQRTYRFDNFNKNFVTIMAAMQTPDSQDWFQGTADAVRQNLRYIAAPDCDPILILSGDQLYRMDFRTMIDWHNQNQADVTIAVIPVDRRKASEFGILQVDDGCWIRRFVEKPQEEDLLNELEVSGDSLQKFQIEAKGRTHLASMGIYLFNRESMIEMLDNDATDFGREIIPAAIEKRRTLAFLFDGYWEDIGTIRSFYEANLALTDPEPEFDFFNQPDPIYTRARQLPASKFFDCQVDASVIADGCIIEKSTIRHSLVGIRSILREGASLQDTIMMGADIYETPEGRARNAESGRVDIGIGPGTEIRQAIIDLNARVGANCCIVNRDGVQEAEGDFFFIREGIVMIPKDAEVPAGTMI